MPKRPLRPCRQPGCPNLVEKGYCPEHKRKEQRNVRESFRRLDERKNPEAIAFYRSARWTKTSLRYRRKHPLCERCENRGLVVPSRITHHDPPLEELWRQGYTGYEEEFLEAVCWDCHQEELREKAKR